MNHLIISLEEKDKTIQQLYKDWAEDCTHLQKLCLKAGYSEEEVYGDSYYVPGIMDLADMLFERLEELEIWLKTNFDWK